MKLKCKNFDIPRHDPAGRVLSTADYGNMKENVLRQARLAWNALDQSDAPRFQEQTAGDVAEACSRDGGLQPVIDVDD